MYVDRGGSVKVNLFVRELSYIVVRTDLTGKLSKHIYAPDQGLKLPS